MTHGSLFSGIGGFDLAAQWMGWENVFHCEWNPFGQKILHHYWPNAIQYHDITKTDFSIHRGAIDILTGGFPCQPYSMAGKRLGKEDERHLWPEMLRAIREIRPRWVVGENVLGLVNWSGGLVFHEVQADLEAEGYEVQPFVLPACAVNAPHRRDRIWFVAYAIDKRQQIQRKCTIGSIEKQFEWGLCKGDTPDTDRNGLVGSDSEHEEQSGERGFDAQRDIEQSAWDGDVADTMRNRGNESREGRQSEQFDTHGTEGGTSAYAKSIGQKYALENRELERRRFGKSNKRNVWDAFPSVSPICHGDDGLPDRLDNITFSRWRQESIKGGGNAVVPQVVLRIFETIEEYENQWTPPNPPASSTSSSPD